MKKIVILLLIIGLLISSAFLLNSNPVTVIQTAAAFLEELEAADENNQEPEPKPVKRIDLAFSETGHFYDSDIEVAIISSVPGAVIYFTTDGSEPTRKSKPYSVPLSFQAKTQTEAVVIKAMAAYGDIQSNLYTHTYFIGNHVHTRFTTLVFSLSTDEDYLYDYDTGIFVEGRLRKEYKAANPKKEIIPPDPANFNIRGREGERPVYLEVFTAEGERVIAQGAGMRVHGGWSRAINQKSIRLIARREYSPEAGKFHYDFFPGETASDLFGTPLRKFDDLILRNGANDRDFGMLRNEVLSRMAREAGFREVTPARAAAVFLNGKYYGFAWLQVKINEQYLQDVYETPTQDFDIVGNGEYWLETPNAAVKESLWELNGFSDKDLTDDKVFKELETLVDIDNFLWYYAFEIYIGNNDWPENNMKRWRYTGPRYENMPDELDGRWRYILYDIEMALGLYDQKYTDNSFEKVIGGAKNSPLLTALLKREDMAARFSAILCDIAFNVVNKDNVRRQIDTLFGGEAEREIMTAYSAKKYSSWINMDWVRQNHKNMITFAENRSKTMMIYFANKFSFTEMFDIQVINGEAKLNTVTASSGRYFSVSEIPVQPVLKEFEVLDYWLVNGKKNYDKNLFITVSDAVENKVEIEAVTRMEYPLVAFETAYSDRAGNGCALINYNEKPVSTRGLYLSDSTDNPFFYELPEITIKPGESVSLAGKGNKSADDLLKVKMSFRVRPGAVLLLSDEEGNLLDFIIVE